jgi:hypothetical protein
MAHQDLRSDLFSGDSDRQSTGSFDPNGYSDASPSMGGAQQSQQYGGYNYAEPAPNNNANFSNNAGASGGDSWFTGGASTNAMNGDPAFGTAPSHSMGGGARGNVYNTPMYDTSAYDNAGASMGIGGSMGAGSMGGAAIDETPLLEG